ETNKTKSFVQSKQTRASTSNRKLSQFVLDIRQKPCSLFCEGSTVSPRLFFIYFILFILFLSFGSRVYKPLVVFIFSSAFFLFLLLLLCDLLLLLWLFLWTVLGAAVTGSDLLRLSRLQSSFLFLPLSLSFPPAVKQRSASLTGRVLLSTSYYY